MARSVSKETVMYKHILIPTDGSELSMKAVEHGVLLARALKARVTSITVTSLSTLYEIEPASFTKTAARMGI
jgi:nucleotide-binding universal stress UspA family protein